VDVCSTQNPSDAFTHPFTVGNCDGPSRFVRCVWFMGRADIRMAFRAVTTIRSLLVKTRPVTEEHKKGVISKSTLISSHAHAPHTHTHTHTHTLTHTHRPTNLSDLTELHPSVGINLKYLLEYNDDDFEENFTLNFAVGQVSVSHPLLGKQGYLHSSCLHGMQECGCGTVRPSSQAPPQLLVTKSWGGAWE